MSREIGDRGRESGIWNRESKERKDRPFHERLDLFQLSRRLVIDLYRDTAKFPTSERFGLTPQIRRAAVSIPANIAEGAARSSKKEFAQFLSVARGSAVELHLLLDVACDTGSMTPDRFQGHAATIDRLVAMINGLMRRTKSLHAGKS